MPSPERGFDRISPFYDALARLFPGGWIPRSQRLYLDRLGDSRRALIVGGGNGGFLRDLLRSGFRGDVVYLDLSAEMIRRARRRVADLPEARVEFRRGDARDLGGAETFDLICTNYILDVFTPPDLDRVMRRLDRALEPGGLWLCTDFSPPGGSLPRRWLQRALLRGLYAFFGAFCGIRPRALPPIDAGFAGLGYVATSRREPAAGVLWSALYRKASPGQAIRSRVTASSEPQPQSAIATSSSFRNSSRTRATPA